MKEAIKIRVNNKQNDVCTGCGKSSKDEKKEFYDMMIGNELNHLCFDCMEMMFRKTLKAQVNYQGKLKSPNKNIRR